MLGEGSVGQPAELQKPSLDAQECLGNSIKSQSEQPEATTDEATVVEPRNLGLEGAVGSSDACAVGQLHTFPKTQKAWMAAAALRDGGKGRGILVCEHHIIHPAGIWREGRTTLIVFMHK